MNPAAALLRRLLGTVIRDPAAALGADAAAAAEAVGRRDAQLAGWYQADAGLLYRDFSIGADDVVVDAGSEDGEAQAFCAARGARPIAADFALLKSGASLPLPDQSASRIYTIDLLQRMDDPARALAELTRIGRPGARYLLAVPDPVQERIQRQFAPPERLGAAATPDARIRGLPCGQKHLFERDVFAGLISGAGLTIDARHSSGFFWALYFALFWTCDVDRSAPSHPALVNWVRTWDAALAAPQGPRLQRLMDEFMPFRQVVIARKPD
jgi:SAM-dependent methyltransferase